MSASGEPQPEESIAGEERSKLMRNLLSNYTLQGFQVISGFVLVPLLIHRLGGGAYGAWYVLNDLIGHTSILYLGLGTAATRFVADHDARSESEAISGLAATVLHLYLVIGVLLLAAACATAPYLPALLKDADAPLRAQAAMVTVLLGAVLAVNFPGSALGATLRGLRRYDLSNGIALMAGLVRLLAIIFLVRGEQALIRLALITLAASLIEQIGRWIAVRRLLPSFSIHPRLFSRAVLSKIKGLTAGSFVVSIAERLIFSTDTLVISIFLGVKAVATYAIAITLLEYSRRIVTQFSDILTPSIAVFHAHGSPARIRHLLLMGTRFSLILACPLAVGLLILGPPFINTWVTDPDVEHAQAHLVLFILVAPHLLRLACSTCGAVLWGINRVRFPATLSVLEALTNLILSLVFVKICGLGLAGVALGTAIPMVVASCFLVPRYTCARIQLEGRRLVTLAMLPPLLSSLPMAALLLLTTRLWPPTAYLPIFVQAILSTMLFGAVCWRLCLDDQERHTWKARLLPWRKTK